MVFSSPLGIMGTFKPILCWAHLSQYCDGHLSHYYDSFCCLVFIMFGHLVNCFCNGNGFFIGNGYWQWLLAVAVACFLMDIFRYRYFGMFLSWTYSVTLAYFIMDIFWYFGNAKAILSWTYSGIWTCSDIEIFF